MIQPYGIFGWPAKQSKSPAMHEAAGHAVGIDVRYSIFEVPPEQLEARVRDEVRKGLLGFNVTVPHKSAVMHLLDEIDDTAVRIGAVNVVKCNDGRLVGTNTDGRGYVRSLEEHGVPVRDREVIIVGAGGATRAIAVALQDAGAAAVHIAARRVQSAERLVSELRLRGEAVDLNDGAAMRDVTRRVGVVVQATSATLSDEEGEALVGAMQLDSATPDTVFSDIVYNPRETVLLRAAAARGLRTVDGLGMLLHQGTLAFETWTGVPAPVEIMRAALERALNPLVG